MQHTCTKSNSYLSPYGPMNLIGILHGQRRYIVATTGYYSYIEVLLGRMIGSGFL